MTEWMESDMEQKHAPDTFIASAPTPDDPVPNVDGPMGVGGAGHTIEWFIPYDPSTFDPIFAIDSAVGLDRSVWFQCDVDGQVRQIDPLMSEFGGIGPTVAAGQYVPATLAQTAAFEREYSGTFDSGPEIPVTAEMNHAGARILMDLRFREGSSWPLAEKIYRAMRSLEPMQVTPGLWSDQSVAKLITERDEAFNAARIFEIRAYNAEGRVKELERRLIASEERTQIILKHYHKVCDKLHAKDAAGDHDYHGPVADGEAIADEVHERFHGAVGDVIAGRVLRKAREQMAEALKRTPPDPETTASKSRPMPGKALGQTFGDPRRMGLA